MSSSWWQFTRVIHKNLLNGKLLFKIYPSRWNAYSKFTCATNAVQHIQTSGKCLWRNIKHNNGQFNNLLLQREVFSQIGCASHSPFRHYSDSPSEYNVVYMFPFIVHLKTFQRFKIYQTVGLFGLGALVISTDAQFASASILVITIATLTLYMFSIYIRRTIGMISLSQDSKTVRVSHLTFWGKRNDIELSVDDIIPLSELPGKPNDSYRDFQTYDGSVKLYLFLKRGQIRDKDKFSYIMGDDI